MSEHDAKKLLKSRPQQSIFQQLFNEEERTKMAITKKKSNGSDFRETPSSSCSLDEMKKSRERKYSKPSSTMKPPKNLAHVEKMARRVIAPYVNMIKKGTKIYQRTPGDRYNFYLTKRSSHMLKNLVSFISNKDDLPELLYGTVDGLKMLTGSLGARLFFVDSVKNEIYQYQKFVKYSRCKVVYPISKGKNVASYVAATKEYVCVADVAQDERFPDGISVKDEVKAVLCAPVLSTNECYAVVELYRGMWQPEYSKHDVKLVVLLCSWIALSVLQNTEGVLLHWKQSVSDEVLSMVHNFFGKDSYTLQVFIGDVLNYVKKELQAEHATFYVISTVDNNMFADVYEEGLADTGAGQVIKKMVKVPIGAEKTVASVVAATGEVLNVEDVYNDERFARTTYKFNEKLSMIHRSELCVPIKNDNRIWGIISIVNKVQTVYFNQEDEEIMQLIASNVCLALQFEEQAQNNAKLLLKNEQVLQLLKYHMKPCTHCLDDLKEECPIPKNFKEFNWYIIQDEMDDMLKLYVYMLGDLIGMDNIDEDNLWLFVLMVQNSYRDNPYHNFEHAFNVSHCMYNILLRNKDKFSLVEKEALMVAAITHDIDHKGVTNNFLVLTEDLLAQLFENSPWENHHVFVTMIILSKFKIFKNLSDEQFQEFLKQVRENILFTDLSYYFKTKTKLSALVKSDSFSFSNQRHKAHLRSILMTIADLSGMFKSFGVSKKLADGIYKEFYLQGDLEKAMGVSPLGLMDRDFQGHVPEDQVNFMTIILIPCADVLRNILQNTAEIYDNCELMRHTWMRIIETRGTKIWRQGES